MRRPVKALAVIALVSSPAQALDLDAFAPKTCTDVGQQLARGSVTITAFNATSQDAVAALRAGRPADGCPALRQALRFVVRATEKLTTCPDAVPDGPHLLAGMQDPQRQIERIGRREGCLSGSPGS